jgi:lysophospholipid acyltransferase (LPLAT)-like uncharacterized protein|tara:strand:+ start:1788 stop:2426 length:639 start_codon:yes stop_codon:yes gene_type:complete
MFKKIKHFFLSQSLKIILNSIFVTCQWKFIEEKNLLSNSHKPRLICCWHSRSLFIARYLKNRKINSWGISSTHSDSEILATVLQSWKIKLIRGSSTRGWVKVIKKMILLFKNNKSLITVTSDGPKGPRKLAKMGSIDLAYKYNASIIATSAISSNYWTLPTWDKTKIPKPFSTIYIKFSIPYDQQKPTQKIITAFINKNQSELEKHIINENI